MKKLSFIFSLVVFVQYVFSQIPNSDMENWTNAPTLIGWETNSQPLTLPPFDPYVVRKDSDAFTGTLAADLHANGVFKPYAKATFAVPTHPHHLSLYYKLQFAPCVNDSNFAQKDTASVLVELLNQGAVVDMGYWQSTITNFNYAQLIVPVSQNAAMFDSCRITLTGGDVLGGCGFVAASTEFIVDHLELKYNAQNPCVDSGEICDTCMCTLNVDPVCGCNGITYSNYCYAHIAGVTGWSAGACAPNGINEPSGQMVDLVLFPVPAKNMLNLQYNRLRSGQSEIRVLNILGKMLFSQTALEVAGTHQAQIVLDSYAKGVYLLELKSGSDRLVKRFVVE